MLKIKSPERPKVKIVDALLLQEVLETPSPVFVHILINRIKRGSNDISSIEIIDWNMKQNNICNNIENIQTSKTTRTHSLLTDCLGFSKEKHSGVLGLKI